MKLPEKLDEANFELLARVLHNASIDGDWGHVAGRAWGWFRVFMEAWDEEPGDEPVKDSFKFIADGLVKNCAALIQLLKAQQEKIDGMEAEKVRGVSIGPARVPTQDNIEQWRRQLRTDQGSLSGEDDQATKSIPIELAPDTADEK